MVGEQDGQEEAERRMERGNGDLRHHNSHILSRRRGCRARSLR